MAEEDGLRGAKEVDLESLRSPFGFVLDHASPIGEVITAAPTYKRLAAEFEGTEAHSGIRPEDGRSAIAAAATAIAAMELGRLDAETTANVGVISGGTASNVVPGHCRVDAEARSLDDERASKTIGAMVDACTWAASEHECDVDVEVREMFRGYRLASNATSVSVARAALERCGAEPREVATGGGSDANALAAAGFECVLLANGTEANHTAEESVAAERIVQMLDGLRGDRSGGGGTMLKLRRGMVVAADPLTVDVEGEERPAWADRSLVGEVSEGDEVIVNTESLDLGLGSGGFDVVHVNLTRGLAGGGATGGPARDQAQLHLAPAPRRAGRGAARRGDAPPRPPRRCSSCRCTATWRPPAGPPDRCARGSASATSRPRAGRCRARCRETSPSFASEGS